jgi:hypothetical protein
MPILALNKYYRKLTFGVVRCSLLTKQINLASTDKTRGTHRSVANRCNRLRGSPNRFDEVFFAVRLDLCLVRKI